MKGNLLMMESSAMSSLSNTNHTTDLKMMLQSIRIPVLTQSSNSKQNNHNLKLCKEKIANIQQSQKSAKIKFIEGSLQDDPLDDSHLHKEDDNINKSKIRRDFCFDQYQNQISNDESETKQSLDEESEQIQAKSLQKLQHEEQSNKHKIAISNPPQINNSSTKCLFCPKLCSQQKAVQMINHALFLKYSSSQNFHYVKEMNHLVENDSLPHVIRFTDQIAFEERYEYLTEVFPKEALLEKTRFLLEYYKFHKEIPRLFMLPVSLAMNKYHDKKRRVEYYQIKRMLKQQQQQNADQSEDQNSKNLSKSVQQDEIQIQQAQDAQKQNCKSTTNILAGHLTTDVMTEEAENKNNFDSSVNTLLLDSKDGEGKQNITQMKQQQLINNYFVKHQVDSTFTPINAMQKIVNLFQKKAMHPQRQQKNAIPTEDISTTSTIMQIQHLFSPQAISEKQQNKRNDQESTPNIAIQANQIANKNQIELQSMTHQNNNNNDNNKQIINRGLMKKSIKNQAQLQIQMLPMAPFSRESEKKIQKTKQQMTIGAPKQQQQLSDPDQDMDNYQMSKGGLATRLQGELYQNKGDQQQQCQKMMKEQPNYNQQNASKSIEKLVEQQKRRMQKDSMSTHQNNMLQNNLNAKVSSARDDSNSKQQKDRGGITSISLSASSRPQQNQINKKKQSMWIKLVGQEQQANSNEITLKVKSHGKSQPQSKNINKFDLSNNLNSFSNSKAKTVNNCLQQTLPPQSQSHQYQYQQSVSDFNHNSIYQLKNTHAASRSHQNTQQSNHSHNHQKSSYSHTMMHIHPNNNINNNNNSQHKQNASLNKIYNYAPQHLNYNNRMHQNQQFQNSEKTIKQHRQTTNRNSSRERDLTQNHTSTLSNSNLCISQRALKQTKESVCLKSLQRITNPISVYNCNNINTSAMPNHRNNNSQQQNNSKSNNANNTNSMKVQLLRSVSNQNQRIKQANKEDLSLKHSNALLTTQYKQTQNNLSHNSQSQSFQQQFQLQSQQQTQNNNNNNNLIQCNANSSSNSKKPLSNLALIQQLINYKKGHRCHSHMPSQNLERNKENHININVDQNQQQNSQSINVNNNKAINVHQSQRATSQMRAPPLTTANMISFTNFKIMHIFKSQRDLNTQQQLQQNNTNNIRSQKLLYKPNSQQVKFKKINVQDLVHSSSINKQGLTQQVEPGVLQVQSANIANVKSLSSHKLQMCLNPQLGLQNQAARNALLNAKNADSFNLNPNQQNSSQSQQKVTVFRKLLASSSLSAYSQSQALNNNNNSISNNNQHQLTSTQSRTNLIKNILQKYNS